MFPSLYVHVPFCVSRCSYCDFYSCAVKKKDIEPEANKWLSAIKLHSDFFFRRFGTQTYKTIYFGGGTPSVLPYNILSEALAIAGKSAFNQPKEKLEFTLEANPEDINEKFLELLVESGVNRLSVGVQSLESKARKYANRRGQAKEILENLECISKHWPFAWSADFIAGLPGQTINGLDNDISTLIDLGSGHISLYALTLASDSSMAKAARAGYYRLPNSDEQSDMLDSAFELLQQKSFYRYEISNWAKPGQESVHNMVYWTFGNWHGLGPAAVSNIALGDGRFIRINNAKKTEYYKNPALSAKESVINKKDAIVEYLLMALRTKQGLCFSDFLKIFSVYALDVFGPLDRQFPELLTNDGHSLKPNDKGMDMLNIILIRAMENFDKYCKNAGNSAINYMAETECL